MRKDTKNRIWGTVALLALIGLAAWIDIPQHPHISLGAFQRDLNVRLGLDLQGGSHLVYRANVEEAGVDDPAESLAGVRDVIERRVNAFGVSEPVIQTNRVGDEFRVIVELAGVHDTQQAIDLIGETPQLDFRTERPLEELSEEEIQNQLNTDEGPTGDIQLFERTDLTGKHLDRALIDFDQVTGIPSVVLEFDSEGSDLFAQITKASVGKRVAIYLDGVPISAPVVQTEITNGRAVITGGFTVDEARELARRLNAGALPVPIELIGQQTVGPTLGRLSIQQSVRAGIIGLSLVIIWMIAYYRLPGFVASVALGVYAILFLALIKLIPVTLTLAGVAGLILSVGMAVDANVLIFERFRENLRSGKTVDFSLRDGFRQAWDSIKASNISSLLTAFILYGFGTSIVRGFALTFSIGILLSMFTAVTITRGFLSLLLTQKKIHHSFLLGAPITKHD